ncbi:MAG: TIGR03086 family metal-binding protein [Dermatophilaceae bacterium]
MALSELAAERHRQVAGAFTERVLGTVDWDAPTPVREWVARDVVRHLVEWFPAFLAAGAGIELDRGPGVDEDPVGAWAAQTRAVQALLDDPDVSGQTVSESHVGQLPLAVATDRLYTSDVFMHTWDLARATGQADRLDPDFCRQLLEGMQAMESPIRSSGHYGTLVTMPADADAQARLLGFIGRDPDWTAP